MRLEAKQLPELALCMACLIAAACAVLYPMAGGKTPLSADGAFFLRPWEEARPDGLEPADANADQLGTTRYVPWQAFLTDTAKRDDSILWNPKESGGLPFLALWRTRCLSPFSLPHYWLSLHHAAQLSAFLKLAVAGLAAFTMAYMFHLPLPMALFVALSFQLGGFLATHLAAPVSDALVWLPLLLAFVDRFSLGLRLYWPFAAITLALMLLGGSPEFTAAAFILCLFFVICRMALMRMPVRSTSVSVLLFAGIGIMAAGLAGMQVAPFVEFYYQAAATAPEPLAGPFHPASLAALLFPRFFGPWAGATAVTGMPSTSETALLYAGLAQTLLLPLWFALRRYPTPIRRYRVDALLLASLTMTLLAFLPNHLWASLPGLGKISPLWLMAGNALALALAAAEAADEWVVLDADAVRDTLRRLLYYLPLFLAVMAVVVFLAVHEPRHLASPWYLQVVFPAIAGILLLGLLAFTLLKPSMRIQGYGLCLFAIADLLFTFQSAIRFREPEQVFPQTSFTKLLASTGGRISGMEELRSWPLAGNLIPQAYGTSGCELARRALFLKRLAEEPLLLRKLGSRSLLLTKKDIQGAFAKIRPALAAGHVFTSGAILFEDLAAVPRAHMSFRVKEIDVFNPSEVTLDGPTLIEGSAPWPNEPDAPPADVAITEETNAMVRIRVSTKSPGVLVLADAWYPGWKAKVDGADTPVLRMDGMMRGVPVNEGAHEVIFRYEPFWFKAGMGISAATTLIMAILFIRGMLREFRARHQWSLGRI